MTLKFTVHGNPVPKARPRVTRTGHAYTPKPTADYERLVAMLAKEAMKGLCPTGKAIVLIVKAYFGIPKSWTKAKKQQALYGQLHPMKRPDLDNCIKAIQDAMNGIVYKDDSQIVEISASKRYSAVPRVDVVIEVFDGGF